MARLSYVADYYDAADRLTDEVNVGTFGGIAYSRPLLVPAGSDTVLVNHTDYSPGGNVFKITDPRGIIAQFGYDMLHRKIQEFDGGISGSEINLTDWAYDGNDNVIKMTAEFPNSSTTPSQSTAYIYGIGGTAGTNLFSNNLIAKIEYPTRTGANAGQPSTAATDDVSNAYDLLGEIVTKTDQNQSTHDFTYDILARLKLDAVTTLGAGVDGSVRSLGYNYTALGLPFQQTSYSDSGGTTVLNQVQDNYNGYGQLIAQYQSHSGAVNTTTTPVTQYAYSQPTGANFSRLTQMIYPNGRALDYVYNSGIDSDISRVSALADDSGSGAGNLQTYTYLGLNTIVQQLDGNGVELTYIHQPSDTLSSSDGGDRYTGLDRFGRVIDQWWYDPSTSATLDRFQYGYDRDGNVLYKNNLVNSSFSELYHANSASAGDDNTAYDNLSRITAFQRGTLSASANNSGVLDTVSTLNSLATSSQSWSLDALGNANSVTTDGTQQNRTFDSQNEATDVGASTLGYDNNGNMTTDDQGHALVYDAWNRLVAVKSGGTTIAGYTYDGAGNRITQTERGATTDLYVTAISQVIEERESGAVTNQYGWGLMYVNDLLLRDDDSTSGNLGKIGSGLGRRVYAQQDANWNVTALVGASGSVGERFIYTSYGVQTVLTAGWSATSDAFGLAYAFQDMRDDSLTAMLHAGERDYLPTLERWLQPDQDGYIDGPNRYQMTHSDPTNRVDPFGLQGTPPQTQPCPCPPDPCQDLANQIEDARQELNRRYSQLRNDSGNLPQTGDNSVQGHQHQFRNVQNRLRNLLDEFNTRCGDRPNKPTLPSDIYKWASADAASPDPNLKNNPPWLPNDQRKGLPKYPPKLNDPAIPGSPSGSASPAQPAPVPRRPLPSFPPPSYPWYCGGGYPWWARGGRSATSAIDTTGKVCGVVGGTCLVAAGGIWWFGARGAAAVGGRVLVAAGK